MKRVNIIASILLSTIALISCNENVKKEYPNVIYILADDLGYGDIGCYGQTKIKTPNLDRMAEQGMLFTQHYSGSTVCAPSRSSLLTGMHTGHTPIRGNKELETEGQSPLPAESFTIAELFKTKGYTTGAFGKWGLGFIGSEGDPNNQGFDEFYGYNCQRQAHRYYPKHLWHNNKKIILEGNDFKNTKVYAADVIHTKALEFIEKNKENPFFMFYPTTIPHAELIMPQGQEKDRYKGKFIEEKPYVGQWGAGSNNYGDETFEVMYYCDQAEPRGTFAAMVSLLDKHVGAVLDKLKEIGIEDNTIVIFTSDNGPHEEGGADPVFFNSGGGFRGTKRDLYEGGIRVPMLVQWNKRIKPGSRSNHVSAFWDVMPTFAEILGTAYPSNIDGISFLPSLLGKEQEEHEHLYWEFHEQNGKQAIRQGDWKLVRLNVFDAETASVELYNLREDPAEEKNVAEQFPELVKEMSVIMDKEHEHNQVFPFTGNK